MHRLLCRTVIALSLVCAACGPREDAQPAPDGTEPPVTSDPAPPVDAQQPGDDAPPAARPRTRMDTIMVEGMAQTETSQLVETQGGFARPFSTYVPEGIESSLNAPSTARFTAAFAGNRNPDAFMEVFVHPSGAMRPAAEDILADLMSRRNVAEHETSATGRPSWALDAIAFTYSGSDGTPFTGSVTVGQQGTTYLHIVRHYPAEYGDGLPPRLQSILEEWRWEDTGEMLR